MPTPLDKDNHGYNKRQAEAQEEILAELKEITAALKALTKAVRSTAMPRDTDY